VPTAPSPAQLDPEWIQRNARIDGVLRRRVNRRSAVAPNRIHAGIATALALCVLLFSAGVALACEAVSASQPCAVSVAGKQTDQYLDPLADLGLSTDPTTQDRGVYVGANPIGNVDTNGHMPALGCNSDPKCSATQNKADATYLGGLGNTASNKAQAASATQTASAGGASNAGLPQGEFATAFETARGVTVPTIAVLPGAGGYIACVSGVCNWGGGYWAQPGWSNARIRSTNHLNDKLQIAAETAHAISPLSCTDSKLMAAGCVAAVAVPVLPSLPT
jgi:hypothetical protein